MEAWAPRNSARPQLIRASGITRFKDSNCGAVGEGMGERMMFQRKKENAAELPGSTPFVCEYAKFASPARNSNVYRS